MASVKVKAGYLTYEGKLYEPGEVLEAANADDIVARSEGRVVMTDEPPAPQKPAAKAVKKTARVEDGGEEPASLPEADPTAAVKK